MATETLASVPEMLQADVAALQTDMAVIKGQLPHLATKAGHGVAELRTDMERCGPTSSTGSRTLLGGCR